MGYSSGNAAFSYDMQPDSYYVHGSVAPQIAAPELVERPRFDVLPGEGREADRAVSPAFVQVVKVFCILAITFCAVGATRVALASATAASLNANAAIANSLEESEKTSSDLEVMRSVYGSSTRIREFAKSMLGMVDGNAAHVTVDVRTPAVTSDGSSQN
ncbi:hypothetical protein KPC83_02570 [Collinsella sp. zg1085]|uniref:hypothetical protein n=1 Tax=Collinsella sp. zg1085 TaxID=2844380 RepID=UPI001C0AFD50|nr:hypothetical protein [Collinsella sp. zg1085]QWT18038.1 hypothetical protein KPC83_02570 [Collinsella sp. zg1085]